MHSVIRNQASSSLLTRPKWEMVYQNFPKVSDTEIISGPIVFTEVLGINYDTNTFGNACATRVSMALYKSGVTIKPRNFIVQQGPYKGKGFVASVTGMQRALINMYGEPDYHIKTTSSALTNAIITEGISNIGHTPKRRKGIYLMRAANTIDFGASGHTTLWLGDQTLGNDYIHAAKEVMFWELPHHIN